MLRRSISLLAACSLCLATVASLTKKTAVSSGTFNVLSMSIHGISTFFHPNDNWGDRDTNTKYIGQKMSQYDYGVINVQEDFNYHATLYKYDNHTFRTATSGGVLFGSGLNTLSKYDWVDFLRVDWRRCGDSYRDDCDLRRGFTFMRVQIEEGVYIDMINLHVTDGMWSDDRFARHSQIRQLADFIEANSAGNAVIVFGDTSSRYTRPKDNIRLLTTQNNLTDAWVQAIGGSPPEVGTDVTKCPDGLPPDIRCEIEDKVFYRGSPILNLNSTGFFNDTSRFLSPGGERLTDHDPVRVEFAYTLKVGLRQSYPCGGFHGTWFNDLPSIPESPKLSYIALRGGSRLDGITLGFAHQNFTHGGPGGDPYFLPMADSGEYVESVKLCWGKKGGHTRIFYAQATTNRGNSVQAGKMTGDCATPTAPRGYGVVGTYGRDGAEVDQLGFIYAQQENDRSTVSIS
ncbi:endonuclease/exonuclease/phosphatase family protein [Rhizoctonia solani 123E]|uniref:Endonuclease/exonuclease/phosphatase family protein n=1 Tax=Rhizoctonia solani 123E TaxID=1423351 RepID=A0A074SK53_9AGAM|nr:endonuclease/exonuclease/phosphatase family protein [Rhizoctonia solani 123E]